MDRRDFVGILAIAGVAGASTQELRGQDAPAKDVTRKLAHWIVTSKPDDTTPTIRKEAATRPIRVRIAEATGPAG